MSKEKRRVPKLRFPGFTEDWEQRKLVDIFEYLQNNTLSRDSLNYKVPNIKNIHYGDILVKFDEILNGDNSDIPFINSDIDLSKYSKSLLADGDIIFSDTAEDDSVGKAIELQNVNEPFILSGLHTIPCRTLIPFGKGYLGSFLNSDAYRIQLKPLVQGIKVSSISKSALKDTTIKYPNKLEEQEKIGTLFSEITALITLHQRKLNNIKLKKKALLQKLFPKNGERYPELRFPGFTDAWEQRKLSDVLVERNEQQVETREYPLMSFVQGLGVTPKGERYDRSFLVLDQSKKYKRTELGDFIYSSNNLETGSIGINKTGKAVISPVYSIFQGVTIGDSQFIGIMSLLPRFIAKMIRFRQGVVYGQWRIHETDFLDISVLIPSVDERTKITQLILSIEKIITLHQRKLDHLQLQKKALLQQMFV